MSLEDRQRLSNERSNPRIVQLHMALARLRSCVKFMNSGAHPDDETSAMLAALSYRDGMDVSYVCANRGEGGQNDIGTESSAVLGTLRTAEMEAAAKVLDLRLYWLSTHPQDSIFDFGFSKSGEETLDRWGRERTLQRFVHIVRREQPDILCPTFLDVPGQHGHHRAMTQMAFEVLERAADSSYLIDSSNDPAWQISKLYLPAWGGGGSAYDDEEPPPAQTLEIRAKDRDPVTGWSWENLGQQSRKCHLTQGMGRWVMRGDERNWPLHLAASSVDASCKPIDTLDYGIASDFAQWANRVDDSQLAGQLVDVHQALGATIAAFPDVNAIIDNGFAAVSAMTQAIERAKSCSSLIVMNRLERKQAQLAKVIMLASGVTTNAWTQRSYWRPGDSEDLTIDTSLPDMQDVQCDIKLQASRLEKNDSIWSVSNNTLSLNSTALPDTPYPDTWLADEPTGPVLKIKLTRHSLSTHVFQPLETPPVVLPQISAQLSPDALLINLNHPPKVLTININKQHPESATASFRLPEHWVQETAVNRVTLHVPPDLESGSYKLPLELDRHQAHTQKQINYTHIKPALYHQAATLRVCAINIKLPDVRIGYVGGGNDNVAPWLRAMGFAVQEFDENELLDAAAITQALGTVDTLVIGVFAYRMRSSLTSLADTINSWIEQGGHLLTLYHRPWDNWDPDVIPPARLEIGQPSLRYRITNQDADIHYLQESHTLLNYPNTIGQTDWQGWKKERGLYFAKSWDSRYTPLLSMSDPNENPHEGALLVANIGKGRHIHTSLILHYQMDQLVPGAFRLMANLVA